jgi:CheY-like chemotaxis protein/HPt (histidine-containing phosphotransfer) domain-containing protein
MKKIAIIEDDLIVANIYRNKLTVDGFQVEVAHDGPAGLELVKRLSPDIVLLDLMLPKMPGLEVLKLIRAEPDFQAIPVIVFSSTYLTNVVQDAWKAGATKCLSKASCTPKQIIEVVRGALNLTANSHTFDTHITTASAVQKIAGTSAAVPKSLETLFQNELQKTFAESLPGTVTVFRNLLQNIIKAENETSRLNHICDLCRRVHALTGNAALAGATQIARMADAFEVLLRELYEKPKNINPSTLRTVAASVDFLGILFDRAPATQKAPPEAKILVVDDDPISRRAVTFALEKAKLKSVDLELPLEALSQVEATKFDLIFLDVDMPQMSGYELCSKLRTGQLNKKTPVVFVTNLNDFENRANSTMSGGNDFIGKPFMFIELAVKALIHVLRGQLEPSKN